MTKLSDLNLKTCLDAGHEELLPLIPHAMSGIESAGGLGNQADFWNQVCVQYKTGKDIIADPFTAIAAIPAATSSMRNMSAVRFNVPEFIPEKCTGCAKCWTQCPDSAIPGVVSTVEEVLEAAVRTVATPENPLSRFSQLIKNLGNESTQDHLERHLQDLCKSFVAGLHDGRRQVQLGCRTAR